MTELIIELSSLCACVFIIVVAGVISYFLFPRTSLVWCVGGYSVLLAPCVNLHHHSPAELSILVCAGSGSSPRDSEVRHSLTWRLKHPSPMKWVAAAHVIGCVGFPGVQSRVDTIA